MKLQAPGRDSFISSGVGSNTVTISQNVDEEEIQIRPLDDNHFDLLVKTPSYRPVNAVKALARMALFVVDINGAPSLEHINDWIRGKVVWLPVVYHRIFVPGTGQREVRLVLATTDVQGMPPYLGLFVFSTTILILHLLDSTWTLPDELPLSIISGTSPYAPHVPAGKRITITEDVVVPASTGTMTIAFSAKLELSAQEMKELGPAE